MLCYSRWTCIEQHVSDYRKKGLRLVNGVLPERKRSECTCIDLRRCRGGGIGGGFYVESRRRVSTTLVVVSVWDGRRLWREKVSYSTSLHEQRRNIELGTMGF
jgi:hypothetical protein